MNPAAIPVRDCVCRVQGRVVASQKSFTICFYGKVLARPYTTLHPTHLDAISEEAIQQPSDSWTDSGSRV
jgi:hypothetical protein